MVSLDEQHKAISALPPLKEVLAQHGILAKKSLGQNFLFDLNVTHKIARQASITPETHIIEIGPGPGGLTRALLGSEAKTITVVEKDTRFIELLSPLKDICLERFNLIDADALTVDLCDHTTAPRIIVANLPYNVATPLLIGWLQKASEFEQMILMFQKEVAERIYAKPKTKAYGRLSVMAQWLCNVEKCFDLPPQAFTPPPKITSTVAKLTPKKTAPSVPFKTMEKVVQAAFAQRRKMIRQSLKSFEFDWNSIDIPETARAEELSVDDFVLLTKQMT